MVEVQNSTASPGDAGTPELIRQRLVIHPLRPKWLAPGPVWQSTLAFPKSGLS